MAELPFEYDDYERGATALLKAGNESEATEHFRTAEKLGYEP